LVAPLCAEDELDELASMAARDDSVSGFAFTATLIRLWPPPQATGPAELRVHVTQSGVTLLDEELTPDYHVTHRDRCHVCELADVELPSR
jgi:hypothetical protein